MYGHIIITNTRGCRVWFERLEPSPTHITRATPARRPRKAKCGEDRSCNYGQVRTHVDSLLTEFWLVCALHGFVSGTLVTLVSPPRFFFFLFVVGDSTLLFRRDQLVTLTTMTPHTAVRIVGITHEHGLLRTTPDRPGRSSEYIDLQPDGNSFDIMAGLIKAKS